MTGAVAGTGRIYIAQGEQAVGAAPDLVIQTILGSCVAVCLRDRDAGIGGMNHMLLPDTEMTRFGLQSTGAGAMEQLINALLKSGADKARLEAKLFGGAAIVPGLSNIGARNIAFARDYLRVEGIPCVAESSGGTHARHIKFWPATGRAHQRLVENSDPDKPVTPRNPAQVFEIF